MRKTDLKSIKDDNTRTAFQILNEDVINCPLLMGSWKRFELDLKTGVNTFPHGLTFIPDEILMTYTSASGVVWNYSAFTKDQINVSCTSAGKVKGFWGKYTDQAIG